jgi:hypothetical protein
VSYGTSFTRHAITAVRRLAQEMLESGNPSVLLRGDMPHAEFQSLLHGAS